MLAMTADELRRFLDDHFPQIQHLDLDIERLDAEGARVRLPFKKSYLRPGGTLSGPTLVMLADVVMYLMVLSRIGPVPLAVTTGLNINFLRRPKQADLIGEGELLKLGQRLAVGEVRLYADGEAEPVAQATLTFSIPRREKPRRGLPERRRRLGKAGDLP